MRNIDHFPHFLTLNKIATGTSITAGNTTDIPDGGIAIPATAGNIPGSGNRPAGSIIHTAGSILFNVLQHIFNILNSKI